MAPAASVIPCFTPSIPVKFRNPQSNPLATPVLLFNIFAVLCDVPLKGPRSGFSYVKCFVLSAKNRKEA